MQWNMPTNTVQLDTISLRVTISNIFRSFASTEIRTKSIIPSINRTQSTRFHRCHIDVRSCRKSVHINSKIDGRAIVAENHRHLESSEKITATW